MNAPDPLASLQPALDPTEPGRTAVLNRFDLQQFQHLSKEDLLLAQSIAGHGDEWGIWETPITINPGKMYNILRVVNLAKRLRDFLAKEPLPKLSLDGLDVLVEEGVLVLNRIALLLRLAPLAGRRNSKKQGLKPSTLAHRLYSCSPRILARAIRRKAWRPDARGLLDCLTEDDVQELSQDMRLRIELERFRNLATRGWWIDLPPHPNVSSTTDPRGPKPVLVPQKIAGEWRPIPDAYLAEFGPRNLWLIHDLGPNLLPLLEDIATHLENRDWSDMTQDKLSGQSGITAKFITMHLQEYPWKDRTGKPLKPAFPLTTGSRGSDKYEWPPRTYEQLKTLSATLQSAHLFLTLLASASRIGEVETLPRSCVMSARDGKDYVRGWTYKLSGNLFGDARQWPAPMVLVQALGQQVRLANVWSRLPQRRLIAGPPTAAPTHNVLWLSLGSSPNSSAAEPLGNSGSALRKLAERIGMDPKPGGINLHPHRCRKTIGRLAGVTLFDSPLVLKRLFGHKSIEMTLHYILCDKDIRTEAEAVLRELRILHCAEALEEVREALARGFPLPGHSGAAASRMVEVVKEHEARLAKSNRVWSDGSAYDLAFLMTANGKAWRFCRKDIICTKVPGEKGCGNEKSNCKPDCDNRIVLALKRRDVREIVESHLDVVRQALDDGQFGVFYYSMQQILEELDAFPDIKAHYMADPQVQSLVATYQELAQ